MALVLTALADSHASRGPAKHPGYDGALAMLCDRMLHEYIDYRSQTARQPLLTGKDLIAAGFTPGPLFSVLLEAVEEARADGKVRTRPEALRLAQTIAARRPSVGTKE